MCAFVITRTSHQAKLARAVVREAAEHEDTAVADGERVEVLRKELEVSLKCGQCGAAVQTQWHVLGECQNPALVGVRRSVAGDLQEKTRKRLMAMQKKKKIKKNKIRSLKKWDWFP